MTSATITAPMSRHYSGGYQERFPETASNQLWKAAGKYGISIVFAVLLSYWVQGLYKDLKDSWARTNDLAQKVITVVADNATAMTKLANALDRNTETLERRR